ncbi:O-antigen ligase family protein [Erythrobacter alti]|uniref:O-antigen ligase family protein n=1 Tax=Erythrobacter alti TaxID=1896145 RepID=UPI0030F44856
MISMPQQLPAANIPLAVSAASTSGGKAIFLAVALIYSLLLPPQTHLNLGGFVLPPYRLLLIPATIFIIRELLTGRTRFRSPDMLVVIAVLWIGIALINTMGMNRMAPGAGAQFIDIALAYFLARTTIKSPRDMRLLLIYSVPGLFLAAMSIIAESVSHRIIVQSFAGSLLGGGFLGENTVRLGLLRAPGPFPHAILAGLFLSSFLPLFFLSRLRGMPRFLGILAALASFFTVSSAAILALVVGLVLLGYDWITRVVDFLTWRIFLIFAGITFFVLEFATQGGAISIISRVAALNSWNAFYRTLIWRYGSESVQNYPIFGIGYNEWVRPMWMTSSVDNFWLMLAMQYGLITPIALLVAVLIATVTVARSSPHLNEADLMMKRGVAMALVIFTFGIYSVSVWLSAQVWYFMLLGIAVTLGIDGLQSASPQRLQKSRKR